jgi:hypothetical protein
MMLALAPLVASAQTADPPNPLKTVKALNCHFPVAVSGTWKNGEAVAVPRTQELLITVTEIDVSDGTAEVAGTAGKAFVSAVLSGWSLYFVENGVGHGLRAGERSRQAEGRALAPRLPADAGGEVHFRAVGVAELRRMRDRAVDGGL